MMLLSGKRRVQAEIQLEFKLFRAGKKLESSLPLRQVPLSCQVLLALASLSLLFESLVQGPCPIRQVKMKRYLLRRISTCQGQWDDTFFQALLSVQINR